MGTLAIFGGSFDPPHLGHVLAVQYVLAVGAADRVIVVPVFQHAFNKQLSPFDLRLKLARLAFCDDERVRVSRIERELPSPNFTLNTVRALKRSFPGEQLRLVVGADVLHDVDKWHHFEELTAEAPLLVLGRAGVEHPDAPRVFLPEVSSTQVRALLDELAQAKNSSDASYQKAKKELEQFLPARVLDALLDETG